MGTFHVDYRELFKPFLTTEVEQENGDIDAFCPVHENPQTSKKPSARINFKARGGKGIVACFVCNLRGKDSWIPSVAEEMIRRIEVGELPAELGPKGTGRVYHFKGLSDSPGAATEEPAKTATAKKAKPLPTDEMINDWVENLLENEQYLRYIMEVRGFSKKTIKARKIGWVPSQRRYSIPIYEDGKLANVRLYRPKATKDKVIWYTHNDHHMLVGLDAIADSDTAILFEGETDQILAQQDGLPAITHTAGAGTFLLGWSKSFAGKRVYIAFDADDAGRKGREMVAKKIAQFATEIYYVDYPTPGSDYTDFRVTEGNKPGDFRELMERAVLRPVTEAKLGVLPDKGEPVSVTESQNSDHNGKPLEILAAVTGKTAPAYSIPKVVDFNCDQSKGTVCKVCPMSELYDGHLSKTYQANDPIIGRSLDASEEKLAKNLRADIGARCSDHLETDIEAYWSVEHLVIQDSIDSKAESVGVGTRDVYSVGTYNSDVNSAVRVIGQQIPDPRNQRGMFIAWGVEPVKTSLDMFAMTDEIRERLTVFQPLEGQTPLDRMHDIATDLEANVTTIYGRPDLHIAYDIVWHSVLSLTLLGKPMEKGWVEAAIMGDSRTGKSDVGKKLQAHYQSGRLVSCDQATLAGLVGGVTQPTGKSWHLQWGLIPMNDRRLVILDESQSLVDKNIIEQMSSIRSSGVAQIEKIIAGEALARTRLIWIANPPSGSQLSGLAEGAMEAIRQMLPSHEDIARFDFAISVARDEVDSEIINTTWHEEVEHVFTSQACSELVMWTWSRKADQIIWEPGCEEFLMDVARKMGIRYTSDFPLVQAENVRMKLGRIAAAIAARTFSCDATGENLIITQQHVRDAAKFLNRSYNSESFGYGRLSRRTKRDSVSAVINTKSVRGYLSGKSGIPDHNGEKVASGLLSVGGKFDTRSFGEAASIASTEDVMNILRWLEDVKMVRRTRGGRIIEATKELTEIVKELDGDEDA